MIPIAFFKVRAAEHFVFRQIIRVISVILDAL